MLEFCMYGGWQPKTGCDKEYGSAFGNPFCDLVDGVRKCRAAACTKTQLRTLLSCGVLPSRLLLLPIAYYISSQPLHTIDSYFPTSLQHSQR